MCMAYHMYTMSLPGVWLMTLDYSHLGVSVDAAFLLV